LLLPLLVVGCGMALARRAAVGPLRVFCLAIAAAYAVSLPFFVFFTVPERWSYPEAGAILLSDLWTTTLIEVIRPISGLDNCFPSFHTSLAVTVALFAIRSGRRAFAVVMTAMAAAIIFSTVYLGVHWLTDVGAGIIVGVVAYVLGEWLGKRLHSRLRTPAA
jgi:membrane-associated phospholipid phosphatase